MRALDWLMLGLIGFGYSCLWQDEHRWAERSSTIEHRLSYTEELSRGIQGVLSPEQQAKVKEKRSADSDPLGLFSDK